MYISQIYMQVNYKKMYTSNSSRYIFCSQYCCPDNSTNTILIVRTSSIKTIFRTFFQFLKHTILSSTLSLSLSLYTRTSSSFYSSSLNLILFFFYLEILFYLNGSSRTEEFASSNCWFG